MAYTKPKIVAQNNEKGVYAAGCGERDVSVCTVCFHPRN